MAHGRRGNHEGSIVKRNDGRWMARVMLPSGKRRAFYGKTRKEAADKMTAALRDVAQGMPLANERQTVGQFLDEWLDIRVRQTVRPRTFEAYESKVRLYLKPDLGRVRLSRLTPEHVQRAMNKWLDRGLSPRTVRHARTVLRTALGQAVKWGRVQRNVASLVDPPKVERTDPTVFTPEQARAFLTAVEGNRLEALYHVAVALGMRQGEVLGLCWDAVDLDAGTIRVVRNLQRVNGRPRLVEPKTRRSRRTLPLSPSLVSKLRQHRARQNRERLAAGDRWQNWNEAGLVFTSEVGTPLDSPNLLKRFRRILDEAGLPAIRFHDLRHGCASFMIAQGLNPRVVMEQLGHSQISTTMDTYAHVMPDALRDAASQMEDFLAGSG